MNAKREELTAGERRYLEHVHRASETGVTLSQYCRSVGLNPFALYSMRRQMRRKGTLPPAQGIPRRAGRPPHGSLAAGGFVAVRVVEPAAPAVAPAGMVCRLRHPSG
ncbi:MAG: transposase, partial [Steroidobacteraceae bacterium]